MTPTPPKRPSEITYKISQDVGKSKRLKKPPASFGAMKIVKTIAQGGDAGWQKE
jgi:hypothetical protein